MIKRLEESGKFLGITAFKGVQIRDVEEFFQAINRELPNITVQFFNADYLAGWEHIYFAVLNALTAFKNKVNISNKLAVEILLYASAQRQIRKAIELLGITSKTENVAVVVLSDSQKEAEIALEKISEMLRAVKRDNELLEITDEKFWKIRKLFNVTDEEFEAELEGEGLEKQALKDLIIERVALLATQR